MPAADTMPEAGDEGTPSPLVGEELIERLWQENQRLGRTLRELQRGLDRHSIMSVTDRRGTILEANSRFVEISKYSHEELIGAPQSIVNSGTHPKEFFKKMWTTIRSGQVWHGEICNRAKDGSLYWVATTILPMLDEAGKPERYMSIHTDVTQLRESERRVRKLAFFDQLTGLPNQTAIIRHLDEATKRPGSDYRAMLTIGFDDLLLVNDALGYETGDRMLCIIAQTLTGLIEGRGGLPRTPSTAGRLSSKHFALCFSALGEDREEADRLMESMVRPISELIDAAIKEQLFDLSGSNLRIAYTLYQADECLNGDALFTRAQMAWRRAQPARGVPTPSVFDESMIAETNARVKRVFDMRRGIANDELVLFLQPVVDSDRRQSAFEALVRWQDPERGLVMPDDFIPLAEQTGLIIEIGTWVLDEACRMLAEFTRYDTLSDLVISVNVSELQLRMPNFVDIVLGALRRHGVSPDKLKLEITESMVHANMEESVQKLESLRDQGVEIALDDFGEGYSSLSALKSFPVQYLKIDRSLVLDVVDDPLCAGMVDTVVGMAHLLGLVVVAEGVETEPQFRVLREIGVDLFQGYLFGRPARVEPGVYAP